MQEVVEHTYRGSDHQKVKSARGRVHRVDGQYDWCRVHRRKWTVSRAGTNKALGVSGIVGPEVCCETWIAMPKIYVAERKIPTFGALFIMQAATFEMIRSAMSLPIPYHSDEPKTLELESDHNHEARCYLYTQEKHTYS